MNRVVRLVQDQRRRARALRPPPGVAHHDPERERAGGHAVNFVEAGSFRVRTTGGWQTMTARSLFVTTPGAGVLVRARRRAPCGLLPFGVVLGRRRSRARARAVTLGDPLVRPLTNRHAFLRRALARVRHGRRSAHGSARRRLAVVALGRPRRGTAVPAGSPVVVRGARRARQGDDCSPLRRAAVTFAAGSRLRDERVPLRADLRRARGPAAPPLPDRCSPGHAPHAAPSRRAPASPRPASPWASAHSATSSRRFAGAMATRRRQSDAGKIYWGFRVTIDNLRTWRV